MQKELLTQWNEISKSAMEPLLRLNQLSSKIAERVTKQQLAITKDFLETGVKQFQTAGNIKSVQDAVQAQSALATEYGDKFKSYAQQALEIVQETQAELSALMQETMKQVSDKVAVAASAAAPVSKKAA